MSYTFTPQTEHLIFEDRGHGNRPYIINYQREENGWFFCEENPLSKQYRQKVYLNNRMAVVMGLEPESILEGQEFELSSCYTI